MTYTNEEIEKMQAAMIQIENWIQDNICPYLRDDLKIGFDGATKNWTLYLRYDSNESNELINCYDILLDKIISPCLIVDLMKDECFDGMYAIISNWQYIKIKLLNQVERINNMIDTINNFKL